MKKILKKIICLTLSFTLFLLNGQVFAQKLPGNEIIPQAEIDELNSLSKRLQATYKRSRTHITNEAKYIQYFLSDPSNINPYAHDKMTTNSLNKHGSNLEDFQKSLEEFQTKMRNTYQKYFDALPEGTYLKRATTKYITEKMDALFKEQNFILGKLLDISELMNEQPAVIDNTANVSSRLFRNERERMAFIYENYAKDTRIRNLFLSDLAEQQVYYEQIFTWDMDKLLRQLESARKSFAPETIAFFSKPNHTAEELLEYFLKHSKEEQKAVLFALRTTDRGLTTGQLIPFVRYYLKQTDRRLWKLQKYSAESLKNIVTKMPYEMKVTYIDGILDFSPETKALRQEIRQVEESLGKKIINRSSLHLGGTFMVVGAALIALTITGFAINGNYRKSNIPQMAEMKQKIDAGELIPLDELVNFFNNDRNESLLAQDPNLMAEIFETIKTTNNILDNAEIDLSVPQEDMGQVIDEEGQIPADIYMGLNNFDYNKVIDNTGTI